MRHARGVAEGHGALRFDNCINLEFDMRRARGFAEGTALCMLNSLFFIFWIVNVKFVVCRAWGFAEGAALFALGK